jgi:predicted nucleic acid-binding protein
MLSCASALLLRISPCRNTCEPGSSRRPASQPLMRSWTGPAVVREVPCRCSRRQRRCAPIVIVVDASVLATALGDDGLDGDRARSRLRGERLNAPELVDLEVASVLRRQARSGAVDDRRAALALADLAAMPLQRAPHRPLLVRCWELRDNLTIYDAAYIALAEALAVTLLTSDERLARAPGPRCRIEVLRPEP